MIEIIRNEIDCEKIKTTYAIEPTLLSVIVVVGLMLPLAVALWRWALS